MNLQINHVDSGWKIKAGRKHFYVGEYGFNGVIYKDYNAFKTGKGVCYIPEYDFENRIENDTFLFEFAAKQLVASKLEDNTYVATSGYTRQNLIDLCNGDVDKAKMLFEELDWTYPETLLAEWEEY